MLKSHNTNNGGLFSPAFDARGRKPRFFIARGVDFLKKI
jgi:hypothetical protein